mgnify:CR=1 FL=1
MRSVQPLAMRVWDEGANFRDLVMDEPKITGKITKEELGRTFRCWSTNSATSIRYLRGYLEISYLSLGHLSFAHSATLIGLKECFPQRITNDQ